MINFLNGTIAEINGLNLTIEVGGVGMAVSVSSNTLTGKRVGDAIKIPTVMIVREDAMLLYGFADEAEREMFSLLRSVSGIGPKGALTAVSVLGARELQKAILNQDLEKIQSIPGVGKKSGQRMILELSEKISPLDQNGEANWQADLIAALEGLGWSSREAKAASENEEVAKNSDDLSRALRIALSNLSKVK
jgi:holliday junction DNA helicase RuvA